MQTVSLYDEVRLEKTAGVSIYCSDPYIPADETNSAYKAAELFFARSGMDSSETGVSISIEKNIPAQSGLGGGSSDAAAVLRGLNNLYGTNYGTPFLGKLALAIGSDVPFCISGGTQRAGGRGELLAELPLFNGFYAVIIMPEETVNTKHAYSLYRRTAKPFHPDIDDIADAINKRDLELLGNVIGNTFEGLVFPQKQKIENAKHWSRRLRVL
jgi:4-diphosphocytidyl-2-C-methyl-D-erythritol kinase